MYGDSLVTTTPRIFCYVAPIDTWSYNLHKRPNHPTAFCQAGPELLRSSCMPERHVLLARQHSYGMPSGDCSLSSDARVSGLPMIASTTSSVRPSRRRKVLRVMFTSRSRAEHEAPRCTVRSTYSQTPRTHAFCPRRARSPGAWPRYVDIAKKTARAPTASS